MKYSHCPFCGGRLERKTTPHGETHAECTACGKPTYESPKPCNAVIVVREDGAIMFVKRGMDPSKGKWDLPGGFVDPGETLEESVQRKMREEIGTEVEDLRYIGSFCDIYDYRGVRDDTIAALFAARLPGGVTPKAGDDAEDIRFFPPDAIPFDELAFPSLDQALRGYLQHR